jgi:transposase
MTGLTGGTALDPWLGAAVAADLPELRSFANGIRSDKEAVLDALTLPHSSGRVEGTVNKIKTVLRQMYGRAGFPCFAGASSCTHRDRHRKIRGRAPWMSPPRSY